MKGDYEEFHALRLRKNKANSKPNKSNFCAYDGFVIPVSFVLSCGKTIPIPMHDNRDEAATHKTSRNNISQSTFYRVRFEKTKPICQKLK